MGSNGENCDGDDGQTMCTDMLGFDPTATSVYFWTSTAVSVNVTSYYGNFNTGQVTVGNNAVTIGVRCIREL